MLSLSSKWGKGGVLTALALVMFLGAACAPKEVRRQADLATGVLTSGTPQGYKLSMVRREALSVVSAGSAKLEFMNQTDVLFEESKEYPVPDAVLVKFLVQHGDMVEAGEPLAEVQVDEESLRAQIAMLGIEIGQADVALSQAKAEQAETAKDYALRGVEEADRKKQEILRLELSIYESKAAADNARASRQISKKREQYALYQRLLQPTVICAPVSGKVLDIVSVTAGYPVKHGARLASVLEQDVVRLVMSARASEFRFGMPVTVKLPTGVEVAGVIATDAGLASSGSAGVSVRLNEPMDLAAAYEAQNFVVTGESIHLEDALVVSDKALKSEAGKTYAVVLVDGELRKRFIKTGVTGKGVTHVIYGLEEGDELVEN